MGQSVIEVNGRLYDAVTGLPIVEQASIRSPRTNRSYSSHDIHRQLEKSKTLNRRIVMGQSSIGKSTKPVANRSQMISKFAPHPANTRPKGRLIGDIGPSVHPMVQKTNRHLAPAKTPVSAPIKPASVIKKEAIEKALREAPDHDPKKTNETAKSRWRLPQMFAVSSMAFALLIVSGYFAYINLPNLSVQVAATQAGINANYPSYKPDGYRLMGVDYSKGTVSLKFMANAGPQKFTITQSQTSWDSTAVKENYVKQKWGDDVISYAEHGLTIYAHDGNAAWVNGGIFYTILGDAPLSASQIRGIATSF